MRVGEATIDFDLVEYATAKGLDFQVSGDELIHCCPFHTEKHPSFGINLRTGLYHCLSGRCRASGNIVRYVQRIEGMPTYEAAQNWLLGNYGNLGDVFGPLNLTFGDVQASTGEIVYIDESTLKGWDYRHPYLAGRGIEDVWQRRFRVGFDKSVCAITLPWFDRAGNCVGVKKRSVLGKFFWVYHLSSVGPNKITLYGLHHVYRRKEKTIVIVESEIDALWCWQHGFPAVALGTAHATKAQLAELKKTYVEKVIIATDNDPAGQDIASELAHKITWIPDVSTVEWSLFPNVKDVNELGSEDLKTLLNAAHLNLNI